MSVVPTIPMRENHNNLKLLTSLKLQVFSCFKCLYHFHCTISLSIHMHLAYTKTFQIGYLFEWFHNKGRLGILYMQCALHISGAYEGCP